MGWPEPGVSRNAVKTAGDRIRKGGETSADFETLNNWRAAHGYVINTFQSNLRNRTRGMNVPVAQRLKRALTIVDKLRQGRAKDLSTMHDIAGARLVFESIEQLHQFRMNFHKTRAKHELVNSIDKYDYIQRPKESGYRGIHDVYSYQAGSVTGAAWNNLQIELQYRTLIQHAWATAVELSDVLNQARTKFSQGSVDSARFFQLSSEILARNYEGMLSCIPDLSWKELIDEWSELERSTHLLHQLRSVSEDRGAQVLQGFVLLIMNEDMSVAQMPQKTYRSALENLLRLELENPDLDIVLVGGGEDTIRQTFRNYFKNATEFVGLMDQAVVKKSIEADC